MRQQTGNMFEVIPHVLSGRHVRIERLEERHADGLYEIGRDHAIWRYLSWPAFTAHDGALRYIQSAQATVFGEGPQQAFAVIHVASGAVAGTTRYLDMRPDHRGLEIGWTWYGVRFQRTPVNTECKLLLLAHAFETMGCIRVCFKTDLLNVRSQQAIERIGGHRDGVLRNHRIRPDGTYRHSAYYTILEDEWPTAKQRLLDLLSSA